MRKNKTSFFLFLWSPRQRLKNESVLWESGEEITTHGILLHFCTTLSDVTGTLEGGSIGSRFIWI